ncbi:MAG TPA: VWA domain-containing protein, partial [Gammaproteobacteria bacterium]|nr:VWA domain-containing protein [Gammaproteobacteria bacterium]
ALQPFVLTGPNVLRERRWPIAAALAAWILATLALAGPAWQRVPVPAFRTNEALVVALDLSRSMDAADLQPSRLARARLKLLSLLERRTGGQTGLVVFSANAFTVTPLTTDTRTISSLVGALTTDIMPSQGSYIEAGLDKAASLLKQANANEGEILLISDADVSAQALEKARALRRDGIRTSVLAVGTENGAPIPERNGGFLTDRSGRVVVPRLDTRGLGELAQAAGGRFAVLTADDRDLDVLEPVQQAGAVEPPPSSDDAHKADVWLDGGRWLALLLLPLVAAGFRRGWLCVWVACCLLPMPEARAQAPAPTPPQSAAPAPGAAAASQGPEDSDARAPGWSLKGAWSSLWRRPDQRGAAELEAQHPERAARLFKDPEWRGAAQYRAGDYRDSAASLGSVDTATADYNRGNALARAGQLKSAIEAYDRALELAPDNEDARYNRDLVQRLLDQQKSEQQSQQKGDDSQRDQGSDRQGQSSENPQSAQGSDSGTQQQQARNESGEPQQGQASSDESQAGGDDSPADEQASDEKKGDDKGEPKPSDDAQAGEEAEKQAGAQGESPSPQDVEKWASQQAADQWLRRIPQDPGGLLRRKFLYQYQRLGVDQDGHYVLGGDQKEPW